MNNKGFLDALLIFNGLLWLFVGVYTSNWYYIAGSFICMYMEKDHYYIGYKKL